MILSRIIEHFKKQHWMAIFLDFVIVVVGVYLGIYLGNVRDAQNYRIETRQSLHALESEMRADLKRLDEIIAFQTQKAAEQHRVITLLSAAHLDNEEVNRLFERAVGDNDTFYPNSSAYQAMKTRGYLAALPDPALRLELSRLFERDYARQEINAEYYDQQIFEFSDRFLASCWDRVSHKLMPSSKNCRIILRNGILVVRDQGDFYVKLLTGTVRPELTRSLHLIDTFQEKPAP